MTSWPPKTETPLVSENSQESSIIIISNCAEKVQSSKSEYNLDPQINRGPPRVNRHLKNYHAIAKGDGVI